MRLSLFESLQPVCPVCKLSGEQYPLKLARVLRESGDHVVEGLIHCSNVACQREFPIIDGIPVLVSDIRSYLSENCLQVASRTDLSPEMESVLGDCCGPSAAFNVVRQHLSSYTWDHYGDLDPEEDSEPPPGSMLRVLASALPNVSLNNESPFILDAGCSIGRSSFALAERYGVPVIGIDLNYSMLRTATDVLQNGRVSYPRRRVGLVYDRRTFEVSLPQSELVDFWACDALALPFSDGRFSLATCVNLLDCVSSPVQLLASLGAALRPGSQAVFASPYDWSVGATPLEGWIGGHSQRGPDRGATEPLLRRMLDPSDEYFQGLALEHESEQPWHVRMHDRSVVSYDCHVFVARKPC